MTDAVEPEGDEQEAEATLPRFETPNPYLHKLFDMSEYGTVPAAAIPTLRELSPDPEERLLAAVKARHGNNMNRGYLLATTNYLRWRQVFPLKKEDTWDYSNKVDAVSIGGVMRTGIRLGSGEIFTAYRAPAKRFVKMYETIQKAHFWEESNAQNQLHAAIVAPKSASAPSLSDELTKLAALHKDGVLDDAEFQAAKRRLME